MPIRKKGDIDIRTSANGAKVKQTSYTFYSYDKKSAALYFQFRGQDGQPTDLGKATIHLVMILNDDGGKEFIPKSDEIEVISAIRGTAKYVLPEMLLSYEGKVTGYVYMDFDDGSRSDDGQFTFRIKHSMITHVLPKAGDKYVQDFEDVKERVEQAGDSATKDIEKAKDNAESQIGDYVGEVESAKQDISSSASDVQSKASEASEDISNLVKTTEDARDNAVKTMYDLDYSNKNLLTGTSSEWEEFSFDGWVVGYMYYSLEQLGLKVGDTITYAAELDNTRDESNLSTLRVSVSFYPEKKGEVIERLFGNKIKSNEKGISMVKGKIPEGTTEIKAYKIRKSEGNESKKAAARKHKLQKGNCATYWTPNPSEIVTQDQYNKLVNAITNLGGSV
ncbi:phage baseplate upper protein [Tetragenococcus halophilus]|uniref:phage baseplate upper protein n=1 Tax=Tetragenococcus halophilus TaxID=51669 RepID=UPI0030C90F84